MSERPSLTYRPEIDGLRALAVLPVLFFHLGLSCPGGYVGVDIFFVISGFLIGSLVIKEIEAGTFSLFNFWERRVRRLFPALALVIIASSIAGSIWLVPAHLREFGQSVISQPLLISNVYFWRQSGYFETAAEFQPLLHTWSLAVEEQFYLFFPLAMLLLMRKAKRFTGPLIWTLTIISFAWSIVGTFINPPFAFFITPSRIWELNFGVILAMIPAAKLIPRRIDPWLGWIGLALTLYSISFFNIGTAFPGSAALLPCLGTALIIFSNSARITGPGKLLRSKPLVFIGKISYPLYLWHWPIIVFLKYVLIVEISTAQSLGALAVSFVLAALTWKYIEQPFRSKRFLHRRTPLFLTAAAGSAFILLIGFAFHQSDGLASRFPTKVTQFEPTPHPFETLDGLTHFDETGDLPVAGTTNSPPAGDLLVWGDSHAMSMLYALDEMGKEDLIRIHIATRPGLPPVPNTYVRRMTNTYDRGKPVMNYIEQNDIKHILLIARWRIYLLGTTDGNLSRLLCDDETQSTTPNEAEKVFIRNLNAAIREFEKEGISVWLMEDIPAHSRPVPATLQQTASRNLDLNTFARPAAEVDADNDRIRKLFQQALEGTNATLLDPLPFFFDPSGVYLIAKDGIPLYNDAHHLSPIGSQLLKPLLKPVFESASSKN
tara:strand:+ start:1984 stop:3960 length:1977 start_codon:yes stop_codon:yes gene_type:complete